MAGRFCLLIWIAASLAAADIGELYKSFERPPDDARIMMRWWWFGPAVTKPQLEREMKLMKEGGIGGFEVQPVYPVALDDVKAGIRNLPFLSDEFMDALRFTSSKAKELGLRMDLTLGSGWPYGGPNVPIAQAAGRLRIERVRTDGKSRRVIVPSISEGEALITVFARPSDDPKPPREVKDLRDGALFLPADMAGPAEVLFFISSRTGMMVKRPGVNGDGFVLDHYDRAALDNFLKTTGDRVMQAFTAGQPPYAVFCDSLEVYNANWTGDLLQEFQKRRGYDLKPYLPALAMDIGPETLEIRHDYGRTLTELVTERFAAPMQEWTKKYKTRFRIQGYGIPPFALSSFAYADLPEGEGAVWRSFSTSRWASSASHMLGRPVTSSETWTWLHSPSFRATPLDVKVEADRHFLQGINQLVGHGWPYTAEGVEYPGWRFYAAGVFNDKNPWWNVMPDLALYLQRVSHMLRQGTPANDVAVYMSNSDAWARLPLERPEMNGVFTQMLGPDLMSQVLDAGYNLDFFDDGLVERGALNRYRVVVLPGVERVPVQTMRAFEKLARSGTLVVATRRRPSLAPGLKASDAERKEVAEISARLFAGPGVFAEKDAELGKALASRVRPDVSLSPAAPDIGFVHRKTDTAEIYFLTNTANTRQSAKASFRVEGMEAEWWDPITGRIRPAEVLERPAGATTVSLDIEPYGSRLLVFTKRTLPRAAAPAASTSVDLSTGWRATFGRNTKPVAMDKLRSWTDDEDTRYYSGLAIYERDVTIAKLDAGSVVRLEFGEGKPIPQVGPRAYALLDAPVRDAAVVYVNDARAGAVWCPPFSVDVTSLLKAGQNRIRIEVGNTAINYLAGHALPDYRLLNLKYGVRFEPQDMKNLQPLPSGLLGTIQLVTSR